MRERLAARLGSGSCPPLLPPVGGALWRAATEAGWRPNAAWVSRLSQQLSDRIL
jgi:N-acetylglucosamine kinase